MQNIKGIMARGMLTNLKQAFDRFKKNLSNRVHHMSFRDDKTINYDAGITHNPSFEYCMHASQHHH